MKWVQRGVIRIDKVVGALADIGVNLGSSSIIIYSILMFIYVIQRQVVLLVFPNMKLINFAEEWGGYMVVLVGYLGLAYALRKGLHIKLTLVTARLSARVATGLETLMSLGALAMITYLVVMGLDWFLFLIQHDVRSWWPSRTPFWIPASLLITGLVLFALALALHGVQKAIETAKSGTEKC